MRIGIVVPSIYMFGDRFRQRISAPMELSIVLANGLTSKKNEVIFFSGPDIKVDAQVSSADEDILLRDFTLDYSQDLSSGPNQEVSLYEKKKYFELSIVKKAFQTAKENKVDLLHVYHLVGGISHYFTELLEIPTLYTVHTNPPPVGTLEHWRYERFKNQNFAMVSESQKIDFQKTIPDMNFLSTIYHGIDSAMYGFNSQNEDHLVTLSRLVPEKGVDIVIQLAKETSSKLKIATDLNPLVTKSDYYLNNIMPQIDGINTTIQGLLQENEKIKFLQNAKALIFPLQWDEPFGMVMIEAMSCGTPVIAFNRGSVQEIIKDGVTGFIVDPDDHDRPGKGSWIIKERGLDGLLKALSKLGEIDRQACRKHVEENFTVERMVDEYEKVYNKILSKT